MTSLSDPRGPYIVTYTGGKFYFGDIQAEDIDVKDIARGLSNICRWAGQSKVFYSVAQHSVLLSNWSPKSMQHYALLHDAHEAYMGDMPRPLKHLTTLGTEYCYIADELQKVIENKFDVAAIPGEFGKYDDMMGVTESLCVLTKECRGHAGWLMEGEPIQGLFIEPWSPSEAYEKFLTRFRQLFPEFPIG